MSWSVVGRGDRGAIHGRRYCAGRSSTTGRWFSERTVFHASEKQQPESENRKAKATGFVKKKKRQWSTGIAKDHELSITSKSFQVPTPEKASNTSLRTA